MASYSRVTAFLEFVNALLKTSVIFSTICDEQRLGVIFQRHALDCIDAEITLRNCTTPHQKGTSLSNKPNTNPASGPHRDTDFGLRGRYATHPAPKKPSPEEDSPRPESGSKPEPAVSSSAGKTSRTPSTQKPATEKPRSEAQHDHSERKASATAGSSHSHSSRASKDAAERKDTPPASERPRATGQTRRSSEKRSSEAPTARTSRPSERKAGGTRRNSERPSAARARRAEAAAGKNRTRSEESAPKQNAKNAKNTKAANAPTPAEYTPYGFEPSARVGLIMRRAPYVLGGALAVVLLCFIASLVIGAMPIKVTVNGVPTKLSGERTVAAAFEAAGKPAKAGDMYDVTGELLKKGDGDRFAAAVNGKRVKDPDTTVLEEDDAVVFSDGADTEEPLKSEKEITTQPKAIEKGHGTIRVITQEGSTGVSVKKTGEISGKTATVVKKESEPRIYTSYQPNVGSDKVIALTFDDGPWEGTTEEVLDILAANEAKATFFTVGERITDDKVDLLKRMATEGHQICTHTWDHASGSGQGVNLSYMSKAEQREEVEKGQKAIADATGQEASKVFRAPGGNFPLKVWKNVDDLVTAEIGWDIDTVDWQKPGADYIAEQIMAAGSGSIVLMHDGGGDRSQTVEALREALPYLKEQGYRFITIDELLEYPVE